MFNDEFINEIYEKYNNIEVARILKDIKEYEEKIEIYKEALLIYDDKIETYIRRIFFDPVYHIHFLKNTYIEDDKPSNTYINSLENSFDIVYEKMFKLHLKKIKRLMDLRHLNLPVETKNSIISDYLKSVKKEESKVLKKENKNAR